MCSHAQPKCRIRLSIFLEKTKDYELILIDQALLKAWQISAHVVKSTTPSPPKPRRTSNRRSGVSMHLRLVPPEGSAVVRPAWLRMDSLSRFFICPVSKSDFFLARRPRFARVVATGRLSRVTDRQACCLIGPPEPRP